MAFEKSLVETQFKTVDCDNEIRNAPTPQIPQQDYLDNFEPLDNFNELNFIFNQTTTHQSSNLESYLNDNLFTCSNVGSIPFSTNHSTNVINNQMKSEFMDTLSTNQMTNSNFTFANNPESFFQQNLPDNSNLAENFQLIQQCEEPLTKRNVISQQQEKPTKSKKGICMNPNAIAARENRAKKKNEMMSLNNRVRELENENATVKKKYNELKENLKKAQERNHYLESIIQRLPQIATLIDHMKTVPNLKLNGVNLHCDLIKSEDDSFSKKKLKSGKVVIPTTEHITINQNNTAGICFHVKSSQEMSLQFCQICSSKTIKKLFDKKNES